MLGDVGDADEAAAAAANDVAQGYQGVVLRGELLNMAAAVVITWVRTVDPDLFKVNKLGDRVN